MPYFVRQEPQLETLDPEADPIASRAEAFARVRHLLEAGTKAAWVEDENGMMIEDDEPGAPLAR